jgi:hypothetical protein
VAQTQVHMRAAVPAPVRGRLGLAGDTVIATLDRRAHEHVPGQAQLAGIGAFDRQTLEPRWEAWGLPALAVAGAGGIYAYSRSGLVVALEPDGRERWRASVPDDRSAPAQLRGDRDGPFVADIIPVGSSIYLAAGGEILQLDADDGRVLALAAACLGPDGTVVRLAVNGNRGLVATCVRRTGWDDERFDAGPPLRRPPSLESRRTASGDLVAFDFALRQQWALLPPVAGMVYDNRPPVALDDGSLACLAGRVVEAGDSLYVDMFGSWMFVVDSSSGAVRWRRESGGSHGLAGPVAVPGSVIDGGGLMCYDLSSGLRRWDITPDQNGLDPAVTPVLAGERLLVAGRSGVRALDPGTGRLSDSLWPAEPPLSGSIVTPLVLDGRSLLLGIEQTGEGQLIAFDLV